MVLLVVYSANITETRVTTCTDTHAAHVSSQSLEGYKIDDWIPGCSGSSSSRCAVGVQCALCSDMSALATDESDQAGINITLQHSEALHHDQRPVRVIT